MRNKIIEEDLEYIFHQNVNWDAFRGKNVFISGANGSLPAYLVESLLFLNEMKPNMNVKVIGLVRNEEKAKKRFEYYKNNDNLSLIVQNVSDPVQVSEPIDYIIHAASQASPKFFGRDPVGTLKANTIGTMNLLELARQKKVQGFLFISSGEVYGKVDPSHLPINETYYGAIDPLQVRSCYAESKRMGENICVSFHHQFQVPCKIVRPFHIYGPGVALDDGRAFSEFVGNVINNQDILLFTDGSASRDYVYLADATVAFMKILLQGNAGEAYNVGTGKETSIKELVTTIVGLFPEKKLKVGFKPPNFQDGYIKSPFIRTVADNTKITKLGWKYKFSVAEGFRRMILSYAYPFG